MQRKLNYYINIDKGNQLLLSKGTKENLKFHTFANFYNITHHAVCIVTTQPTC